VAPTQNAEATHATAAGDRGVVPLENVEVHLTHGRGLRGGASRNYARQAVISQRRWKGRPVKLLWVARRGHAARISTADDADAFEAALDGRASYHRPGRVRDASHSHYGGRCGSGDQEGIDRHALGGIVDMPTRCPNLRIEFAMRTATCRCGFMRTVFHSQNPFMRECFVDEIGARRRPRIPTSSARAMLQASPRIWPCSMPQPKYGDGVCRFPPACTPASAVQGFARSYRTGVARSR